MDELNIDENEEEASEVIHAQYLRRLDRTQSSQTFHNVVVLTGNLKDTNCIIETVDGNENSQKENSSPEEQPQRNLSPCSASQSNANGRNKVKKKGKRKQQSVAAAAARRSAFVESASSTVAASGSDVEPSSGWPLESSPQEVRRRFELGCECSDDSCFRGLNPDSVYKHRLNIAELTKEEHDMYLMGVTMACMADPVATVKRRARRRLRAHYAYAGRRVCLQAFLYLENVTLYQLKRIRKHVITHGVTPRIHGNHGKKPHNVFSLDIYRRATYFLKTFIERHTTPGLNPKSPVILPSDITRKSIHDTYKEYVKRIAPPDEKIMGYSTFRHFIKEQFPNLRFVKVDVAVGGHVPAKSGASKSTNASIITQQQTSESNNQSSEVTTLDVASLPVILAEGPPEKAAYLVPLVRTESGQFQTGQTISLVATGNSGEFITI